MNPVQGRDDASEQEERKQRWRRMDKDINCYRVALQLAESRTGEIYVATTWFLSVCHTVATNSKRHIVYVDVFFRL